MKTQKIKKEQKEFKITSSYRPGIGDPPRFDCVSKLKFILAGKSYFLLTVLLFASFINTAISQVSISTGGAPTSYTTLRAAFTAINSGTHTGSIFISVTANTTETSQAVLNASGSGAANYTRLVIKPTSPSVTISGNFTGAIVRLNGADRVTIDGRVGSDTTRQLTIASLSTSTSYTAALDLINAGSGNGCKLDTIKYCKFNSGTISNTANSYCIAIFGSSFCDMDSNVVSNNLCTKSRYGVYVVGIAADFCQSIQINNNIVGSDVSSLLVAEIGIYNHYVNGAVVSNNTVFNQQTNKNVTPRGLYLDNLTNSAISSNLIFGGSNTGSSNSKGSHGITLNLTSNANVDVYNNVIYKLEGYGSATSSGNIWGIALLAGSKVNFYNNSIFVGGVRSSGVTSDTIGCLMINSPATNQLNIKNNIFLITRNPSDVTNGACFSLYTRTNSSAFLSCDYNFYYGDIAKYRVGFLNGAKLSISNWRTATGQDVHSQFTDPNIGYGTFLQPGSLSPCMSAGVPVLSVTTDFLGTVRSLTVPSIGAYETGLTPFSGTINIGTGGDYSDLSDAFEVLNVRGLNGNVDMNVISNVTETGEVIALNNLYEAPGGPYYINLKPVGGHRVVSGNIGNGAILYIKGGDRLTIDGRISGAGNNLTFKNTFTATFSFPTADVMYILSKGTNAGSSNITIRNCNFLVSSSTTFTNTGLLVDGASNDSISLIENNFSSLSHAINFLSYSSPTTNLLYHNINISKNTIGSNEVSQKIRNVGISLPNSYNSSISDNVIFNFDALFAATVNPLIIYGKKNTINNNRIFNMNCISSLYGIYQEGDSNLIYNNSISNLLGGSSNNIYTAGIYTSGNSNRIYYNSISLKAYLNFITASNFPKATGIFCNTSSNLDLRNNSISNKMDFDHAQQGSLDKSAITSVSTTYLNINNNNYYCQFGNVGYFNGTSKSNLSEWQSSTGQDGNSISSEPNYATTIDTRISNTSPNNNAGVTISGFDTDLRYASRSGASSIGAYEGVTDATPPVISYTTLSRTFLLTNRPVSAEITDASGINTTTFKPRVYYKKSTDSNVFRGNTSGDEGWKSAEATNTSSPFNFIIDYSKLFGGSASAGSYIEYFIAAQDNADSANLSSLVDLALGVNTASINYSPVYNNNYLITDTPLSGDYTVGSSGAFATLFDAVSYLNTNGINGNSSLSIISDIADFPCLMNEFYDYTGSSYLTIKPSGSARIISMNNSSDTGFIKLDRVKRFIVDGRIGGSGNNLTFRKSNSGFDYSSAFQFLNYNLTDTAGCRDILIRNCNFTDEDNSKKFNSAISFSNGKHTNIRISNNDFKNCKNAIYDNYFSGNNDSLVISGNSFGSRTTDDYNTNDVKIKDSRNAVISGNTFKSCIQNGIYLEYTSSGTKIFNNIFGTKYEYTGATNLIHIQSSTDSVEIYNNVLTGMKKSIASSGDITGIQLTGGQGHKISFNSISLEGDFKKYYFVFGINCSAGISNIELKNNNFSVVQSAGEQAIMYCVYSPVNNPFAVSNHNNFYLSGTGVYLGYVNSILYNILSDWQSATSQDLNSIALNPLNFHYTDLRILNGSPLLNSGTSIPGITTDIVGNTRNATPTIGAHESVSTGIPVFSYNKLADTSITGIREISNISISDGSGIASGGNAPRVYFKKGVNGTYISSAAINGSSPYSFEINQPGLIFGDSVFYFFAAQNNNGAVKANEDDYFSAANVNNFNEYPVNAKFYKIKQNQNYGSNNASGNNLYYFANSTPGGNGAPSQPVYNWIDTIGSTYLVMDGSLQEALFSGSENNGTWLLTNPLPGKSFRFFGNEYTELYINSEGYLQFSDPVNLFSNPVALPSNSNAPLNSICPLWFNFNFNIGGRLMYKIIGTDKICITYLKAQRSFDFNGEYVSFQIILQYSDSHLGNSPILIQYNDTETDPNFISGIANFGFAFDHSVGIQNSDGTIGLNYRSFDGICDGPIFSSPLALQIGNENNLLPVELSSFSANINKNHVDLHWSTISEVNNTGFEVERKLVSTTTWSKVGFVAGAGNSTTVKNYNFSDRNLATAKYNYRLKQIDNNGNFKYHTLSAMVDVGVPTKFDMSQNYPNPFNPTTKINYDLPFDSKVSIRLFDMTGREVAQIVNATQTAGYYIVQFNGARLASGVYFYNIIAEGSNAFIFVTTKKMVLVK